MLTGSLSERLFLLDTLEAVSGECSIKLPQPDFTMLPPGNTGNTNIRGKTRHATGGLSYQE